MPSSGTSPQPQLIEELRDYCEQLENIKEDAQELTATLTNQQFNWRSGPGHWSISECLEHLNTFGRLSAPVFREAIERGRRTGLLGQGPFRYGFLSRKFVAATEPPVKLRVKSPKKFVPPPDQPKDKVVPEFLSLHDQLLELIRAANGLDLAGLKVPAPFSDRFQFSLGQRFAQLAAHDRRHLWQAWRVRKHPDFPLG